MGNLKHTYLNVTNIQRSSFHDGPGVRTTIFFKGCGLRCLWCQNPESLEMNKGDSSCKITIDSLLEIISKDEKYYKTSGGGVTLSGGEPLLQDTDALEKLLTILKSKDIHIGIETALHAPWSNIEPLIPFIDLFYVDLKVMGDKNLHKKLTNCEQKLILDNLEKLLAYKSKILIRMVIVPNHNDQEKYILNCAEFLKSKGFTKIELMKYHSMYEDKAKKLGIVIPHLNITQEESELALENALNIFRKNGIDAYAAGDRQSAYSPKIPQRLFDIQQDQRDAKRALCIDVDRWKTKYYKKFKGFSKPTIIHRAERLKYVLENKHIEIFPKELIVGNFTAKRVAGQTWMEHYGLLFAILLHKINKQKPVSFKISTREKLYYYFVLMPFWAKKCLLAKVNKSISDYTLMIARSCEMVAGFNNNMSGIAHYIVNYERILEKGTTALIKELEGIAKTKPDEFSDFYEACIICLRGVEAFSDRYAKELERLTIDEKDPVRKQELKNLADICKNIPREPASSFHEAVQCMTFIHIALCIESYENAISLGRIDQLLYPYYKIDKEKGILNYDSAKEILGAFVLKLDECILVNDGDSILDIGKNFETLSTAQALTFGGINADGTDAVNDVTYMCIDICELQPLAVNMTARVHKTNPEHYLNRLAEIYIHGCPMPEMFSDEIYIPMLLKHYPTSVENANDYAIVGCVEPIASKDHFGNTDCANVNVVLPFLQALKGVDREWWRYNSKEKIEIIISHLISKQAQKKSSKGRESKALIRREKRINKLHAKRGYFDYKPPESMKELLESFQIRLNDLTLSILTDHQNIERELCKNFKTPLTSVLYKSCVESGKDVLDGGTTFNTTGIQGVGITDVADSLCALEEVVFEKKLYNLIEICEAIDSNFASEKGEEIRKALLNVPKFGDDISARPAYWMNVTLDIYNKALQSVPNSPRNGRYTAGYYALNVSDRYGLHTQAIPSGRLKGVPLANSLIPHYGMQQTDLLSALNSCEELDFISYANNGATATLSIDSSIFQDDEGIKVLSSIFKTYLCSKGMQLQPNIISKKLLIDAYENPEKHPYLMVRVAGYCAYFNELSDGLKKIIINRTCYS